MRKAIIVGVICAVVLMFCAPAFAAKNPGEKLIRGVANIISAPIEIAKQVDVEWKASARDKQRHAAMGIFGGIFKGIAYTMGRIGSGAWDVVSFPFKVPADYEPMMKPDFVLDK